VLVGVVVVAGIGCGDGRWVSVQMMGCKELAELEKDPANFKVAMGQYMFPSTCRDAGGLTYAGDYRCSGETVEVRCEAP
jgi:hypothetical protein